MPKPDEMLIFILRHIAKTGDTPTANKAQEYLDVIAPPPPPPPAPVEEAAVASAKTKKGD